MSKNNVIYLISMPSNLINKHLFCQRRAKTSSENCVKKWWDVYTHRTCMHTWYTSEAERGNEKKVQYLPKNTINQKFALAFLFLFFTPHERCRKIAFANVEWMDDGKNLISYLYCGGGKRKIWEINVRFITFWENYLFTYFFLFRFLAEK